MYKATDVYCMLIFWVLLDGKLVLGQLICRKKVPLDETHLDVMKGLIYGRGFAQCVNKKSSLERRNYARAKQTDLLYANTNDLIQSEKIQIRLASLSIVYFRHLSGLVYRLTVNIYHLFAEPYIVSLCFWFMDGPNFRLWR